MAKATGFGGVFFKTADPDKMMDWYADNLGVPKGEGYCGGEFRFREADAPDEVGQSIFGVFKQDTDYFGPGASPFMINLRVDDLDAMLTQLRDKGVEVIDRTEDMEGIGRFGWFVDPDGRRVELWEPVNVKDKTAE